MMCLHYNSPKPQFLPVVLEYSPSLQGMQSKQQKGSPTRAALRVPGLHGSLQMEIGTWKITGLFELEEMNNLLHIRVNSNGGTKKGDQVHEPPVAIEVGINIHNEEIYTNICLFVCVSSITSKPWNQVDWNFASILSELQRSALLKTRCLG